MQRYLREEAATFLTHPDFQTLLHRDQADRLRAAARPSGRSRRVVRRRLGAALVAAGERLVAYEPAAQPRHSIP